MKLFFRNLAMLPIVIVLRTVPGIIGIIAEHVFAAMEDWQNLLDKYGVYWKLK